MKKRQASPENKWKDFTPQHEEQREKLINAITDAGAGVERDPIAVVGPYRTGKTQLLYEAFETAWEEGIPALYTDANTIFSEFEMAETESISDWLSSRARTQSNDLINGEDVDWLPNWSQLEEKSDFIQEIEGTEIESEQSVILLVDEIEQAYTEIREGEFVDDDNPLRVLLDDTEGVYQVWAFGLVAAYELGEADYARFEDLRIPILSVEDIHQRLKTDRPDVDPTIAAGIWWLSRGRIGWTNKLIDEAPSTAEDTAKWVRRISEGEFEGLTPINNEVWTEDVPSSKWDNARRAILFQKDEYTDWEITHDDDHAITAEDVSNLVQEILLDVETGLSSDAKQLLEENSRRLANDIVPISSRAEDQYYLPANLLTAEAQVSSFIELLSDLVLSFEASTEDRAQVVRTLQEIDTGEIRSQWTNRFYDHIIEDPPVSPWVLKPTIIDEAYPAVAVDPSQLTDRTTNDLIDEIERGIEIELTVETKATSYEVQFCPTRQSLEYQLKKVTTPNNLTKVFVLFTREGPNEIELDESTEELDQLGRLNIVHQPEERIWDFVLHLEYYLREKQGVTGTIRDPDIQDVLADEDRRDNRNTISTLFSQLNEIAKSETRQAVRGFESTFTRDGAEVPLWAESLDGGSGEEHNAPAVYGSGSIPTNSLAFSLGVSRYDINAYSDVADIRATLNRGIDADHIDVSGNQFGFTQFLESTLNNSGVAQPLETFWRRYQREGEARDASVDNLQTLERTLIEINGDVDAITLLERLTNMEDSKPIPVVDKTNWDDDLQQAFARGLLLEDVAVERADEIPNTLCDLSSKISSLSGDLEDISNGIDTINDTLQPPDDYGSAVKVKESKIQDIIDHMAELDGDAKRLEEKILSAREFAGIGVVYWVIFDSYLSQLANRVDDLRRTILGIDLYSVKDLDGSFSQARQLIESNGEFLSHFPHSKSKVIEELDELAEEAFDFESAIGGDVIQPTNRDALEEIEEYAQEREESIREINQLVRQLNRKADEITDLQTDVRQRLEEFTEMISEGVEQ